MSRMYCEHLTPIDETCPECEAMTSVQIKVDEAILPSVLRAYSRELDREKLVLKFHLALLASNYEPPPGMTLVKVAVLQTDEHLQWRDEQRKKQ